VVGIVGQPEGLVGREMGAVRAREQAFAPRAQEIAVAIEHHHRVRPAIEDIDVVVEVDGDRADLAPFHAGRHLGPVVADRVAIFTLSLNGGHRCSPFRTACNPARRA
jgi:hypothetical protein